MRNYIRQSAKELIEKYNTNNPEELAKYLNIHIHPWDFKDDVNGFYKYEKRNKFILIKPSLPYHIRMWVIAHELGHALHHQGVNCQFLKRHTLVVTNKYEIEADLFAAELLIPENIQEFEGYTSHQIAAMKCVPEELVELKFGMNN